MAVCHPTDHRANFRSLTRGMEREWHGPVRLSRIVRDPACKPWFVWLGDPEDKEFWESIRKPKE